MDRLSLFDQIPENVILISGQSLIKKRHMPTPPNVQTVIRDPEQPGLIYEILREEFPADHPVEILKPDTTIQLKLSGLKDHEEIFEGAAYLVIPPLPDQCAFETFQNTVAILRGPHGCPWDKKQTHQSLRDDLLQEVYELLDGLDRLDQETIVEELGDVLLHILLQAQIGVDNGEFTMGDVISHVNDKIIYRHEHVFGNPESIDPNQVILRWEQIKQRERAKKHKKGGLLDGISRSMPALSMAFSYQKRASKAGFEWDQPEDAWQKLEEELNEYEQAVTPEEKEEELGDILFTVVSLARLNGVDPETALRMANLKFYDRLHAVENTAKAQGQDLFEISSAEKMKYWNDYKKEQREANRGK